MKYGLGIKILVSFLFGGIAILYKQHINPRNRLSESSTIVNVPRPFLFDIVSDMENVPKYFTWISDIYEIDTRKNLSVGKQYQGSIYIPFWGNCDFRYQISEIKHGQWIILKPDKLYQSYLNAEIIVMFNTISHTETQFYLQVVYHRPSALFQLTIGQLLKYLTDQRLQETSQLVQEIALAKWKQWQATNITKARETSSTTPAPRAKQVPTQSTAKEKDVSAKTSSKEKPPK